MLTTLHFGCDHQGVFFGVSVCCRFTPCFALHARECSIKNSGTQSSGMSVTQQVSGSRVASNAIQDAWAGPGTKQNSVCKPCSAAWISWTRTWTFAMESKRLWIAGWHCRKQWGKSILTMASCGALQVIPWMMLATRSTWSSGGCFCLRFCHVTTLQIWRQLATCGKASLGTPTWRAYIHNKV